MAYQNYRLPLALQNPEGWRAAISACPPPPYSRTSVAEQVHIGSAAEQEVPGPVDLLVWEPGAVTESVETENTQGLSISASHNSHTIHLHFAMKNTLSLYFKHLFLPPKNILFHSENIKNKLSTSSWSCEFTPSQIEEGGKFQPHKNCDGLSILIP